MSGKKLENNIKIIAEIASSHNGSIKALKKISDIAVKQNADYLKFQIFKILKLNLGWQDHIVISMV